jgi:hypothetical protein
LWLGKQGFNKDARRATVKQINPPRAVLGNHCPITGKIHCNGKHPLINNKHCQYESPPNIAACASPTADFSFKA